MQIQLDGTKNQIHYHFREITRNQSIRKTIKNNKFERALGKTLEKMLRLMTFSMVKAPMNLWDSLQIQSSVAGPWWTTIPAAPRCKLGAVEGRWLARRL